MFFLNIRRNKENILYFILTIICLEAVRIKYNKLDDVRRKENWDEDFVQHKRGLLLTKASMIYGIFLSYAILNSFVALTDKITKVYPGTVFLKTNVALIINIALSYVLSVLIIRILLVQYIKKINGAINFFQKLGRSAWDGTKVVAQAPIKVGGVAKDKVTKGAKIGFGVFSRVSKRGIDSASQAAKYSASRTGKIVKSGSKGLQNISRGLVSITKKIVNPVLKIFKKNNNV